MTDTSGYEIVIDEQINLLRKLRLQLVEALSEIEKLTDGIERAVFDFAHVNEELAEHLMELIE